MNKVRMIEWFDDHFYKVEKEEGDYVYIPSVTTKLGVIAKPFLARWRGDIGNREADQRVFESSERGIRIHHGWYTMSTGGEVLYQPFQHPNYSASDIEKKTADNFGNVAVIRYQDEMYDLWKLKRWVDVVNPQVIASEMIVYSLTTLDAGTVDNLIEIEEGSYPVNRKTPLKLESGKYVVDLKTGSVVDDNAFMQTAAYAKCLEENGYEIAGTLILHTGSKTRSNIEGLSTLYRNKEQMEQDYMDYRLAAALWERKNANAKPKVFEFPTLLTLKKEIENVKNAQ